MHLFAFTHKHMYVCIYNIYAYIFIFNSIYRSILSYQLSYPIFRLKVVKPIRPLDCKEPCVQAPDLREIVKITLDLREFMG